MIADANGTFTRVKESLREKKETRTKGSSAAGTDEAGLETPEIDGGRLGSLLRLGVERRALFPQR